MKNITSFRNYFCIAFLFLGMVNAHSQFITSGSDDGSPQTLRSQIASASAGDVLIFAPGIDNVILTAGEIIIDKSLTITGNFITSTVIDANGASRIFNITNGDVFLNDLILTNGSAVDGGAVMIANASVTITDSDVLNSVANGASGSGGGIFVATGGSLILTNCSITGNTANRAGGGIESTAGTSVTLANVNLSNNNAGVAPAVAAPGNGGGLHITGAGTADIIGGTVTNNTAALEGGGLWNGAGSMDIDGTFISENTAAGAAADNGGGGIFNLSGMLSIANANISSNDATGAAGSGGGILNDVGATLEISNTTITLNTANRAGGGIEVNSGAAATVTLSNVNLDTNTVFAFPGNGGGLHVTGPGVVNITGGTVNENIAAAEGGGLWNGTGTMSIDGTTINANTASGAGADQGGGGIYNLNGGTLTIENATINNNIANGTLGSGGGILNDVGSQLSISDSTISGNTAIRAGGGIEDNSGTSTIILNSVTFDLNTVTGPPGNGGALHITGAGSATMTDCIVTANTASLEGGGLWNGTGTLTVTGGTVNGNIAQGAAADDGGGGIFNNGGTVNINDVEINSNRATGTSGSGGGIFSTAGSVTIDASSLQNNSANRAGGGIEVIAGSLNISNSDLTSNDVNGVAGMPNPGNGGALHITGITTTTITNAIISENEARKEGGGLWNQTGSTMNVTNSTIDGNIAAGTAINTGGGGIFVNGGTVIVNASTISNNETVGTGLANGGGIHVKTGSAMLYVSTISGNSSVNDGGGIFSDASTSLNSCTIADNWAAVTGGGIAVGTASTSFSLKNTIVATNSAVANGQDLAMGSYTSNGFNLIGQDDLDAFTALSSDIEGTNSMPIDPLLGPLADNGGQTFTHALMANSPAYNAGDIADQYNDQTGSPVFGGTRDIGAYEAQMVLGINDLVFRDVTKSIIYPNPSTNGSVNVSLAAGFNGNATATIIDVASGKIVSTNSLSTQENVINVNGFSTGIYAIQITSGNASEVVKLVVR